MGDIKQLRRARPMDEQADFVMSFVDDAASKRRDLEAIWDEVEENFLVQSARIGEASTKYPYLSASTPAASTGSGRAVLKDPETHQEVMTIVSTIVGAIVPQDGFIKSRPVGFEDTFKSSVATKLTEYDLRLEGHFMVLVEWLMSMGIWGTGVVEAFWDYIEEPRELRQVVVDPVTGDEFNESELLVIPVWDDPRIENVNIRDFFPDLSQSSIARMAGAVRRFRISAPLALDRAEAGLWDMEPVKQAIDSRGEALRKSTGDEPEDEIEDVGSVAPKHPDFMELTGYRWCGNVPFDRASPRKEIIVLEGETVRSDVWPRRLPWFEGKITPRPGSFYGISPGELIRYDQDFADTLKSMLADAVTRMVHPPPIYNRNADVDLAKLRVWRPSVPIGVQGDARAAVATGDYRPQVGPTFGMYDGIKSQMRESTGALGIVQGLADGPNRESATGFAGRFQQATQRPELFSRILEREYLPPLGRYLIELNQSFLETSDDLAERIGESNTVVSLADIMPRFDVEFIGSRLGTSKADKIQAFREVIAAGANPLIVQLIPWIPLLQKHFNELGAPEIAAMVGNPQLVKLHMLMHRVVAPGQNGQKGNDNGTQPSQPPAGALPAQLLGGQQ